TCPFKPGIRTKASSLQMASTVSVNRIRDFSSGILKQLLKVLAMAASMEVSPKSKVQSPKLRIGSQESALSSVLAGSRIGGLGLGNIWLCSLGFFDGDDFALATFGFDFGTG